MRAFARTGLVMGLLLAAAARLPGQSTISWAGPPLFILDVQGTPLDEFPNGIKALGGVMTAVDKNGQRMLMASSASEFLIKLPQVLPAAFTVVVDLIPKACCSPEDFMLEGMPSRDRGVASVELTWQPSHIMAVGGGGEMYQSDMPADLAATTPGNLTQLVFEFNGTTIKLYTNGRRMYTLDKQFARGQVLRVWLGGETSTNPMYLAGLSVLSGAVASSVIAANTGGATPPPGGGTLPGGATPLGGSTTTGGSASTAGGSTQPINLNVVVGPLADFACLASWCPDWNGSNGACVTSWCPDWNPTRGACITSWCPDWNGSTMSARKVTWSWSQPPGVTTPMATFDLVVTDPATGALRTTRLSPTPVRLSSGASIAVVAGTTIKTCLGAQIDPSDPTNLVGPTCQTITVPATQSQAMTGSTPTVMRMGPTVTQGSAGPIVQWALLNGATGYTVKRWLSTDLTCCNNASGTLAGSPWQDQALLANGTYVYEVTANVPGAPVVEQTQFTRMMPVSTSTPSLPAPIPGSGTPPAPVVPAPIAASTGTPVRTSSAPPPGSGAAAALAPTNKPPVSIAVTGTPSLAQLNWGSGISGMRGVTYKVDRWLQSDPTCCAAQSATLTFPAWTDEGLQWSGTYVFRITELYPDGTFGVATTTYMRPDPVNPANFRATVSAGSVYLRWDVVPNASWYELSGPGLGLPNFYATTGAYNVHNLTPGTYTWRVGTFYSSPNAPAPVSGPPSAFPSVTVIVP